MINPVRRWIWIFRCTRLIKRQCGWTTKLARDYAETLHQSYVEEYDADCSPEDALSEDMSYWEAE